MKVFPGTVSLVVLTISITFLTGGSVVASAWSLNGWVDIAERNREPEPVRLSDLPGRWDAKANLPNPVQEVTNVAVGDGKVYVLGGQSVGFGRSNRVQVYDTASDSWFYLPHDYPHSADHVGVAVVNGTLYAFGGLLSWPVPPLASTYAYDPNSGWVQKADMPEARSAMGVAVLDDKIYVSGGLAGLDADSVQAVNNLWRYDPGLNTWESLADMPTARDHHVMETVDGKLYAIGGRNSGHFEQGTFTNNEVYDPLSNSWTTGLSPLPTSRAGMGSAVLNDEILLLGGEGWNGSANVVFNSNEAYNPGTNTWRSLEPLPNPVHGAGGAVYGDVVYLPGGGTQVFGGEPSDVLQVFYVDPVA